MSDSLSPGELLREIQEKNTASEFEYTRPAVDQSLLRRITVAELRAAVLSGEVIEDYPRDKDGPSRLIFGCTEARRALHVRCSSPSRPKLRVNTMYEPNTEKCIDLRRRRR